MEELSYVQIQDILNKSDLSNLPLLKIAVLRNIMLEPIEPYFRYMAYKLGFNAQIQFGEYDNIVQEAIGSNNGLFDNQTDCVMIFMKMETLSWNLARNFVALSHEQVLSEVSRIKVIISSILSGIRIKTPSAILFHGFEAPVNPCSGIYDSQLQDGQCAVYHELNSYAINTLKETKNAFFADMNICLAKAGANNFYDNRYWHIGKAPLSRQALAEIAFEDFKFIRAIKGKNKKCLVLDCDNTLWGGIIGEDDINGIKLGKTYPGSAYIEFQQEILNLYHRGIIIALCSKNNDEDVWEVFRNHPDMVLKESHIAASQINWNDKAANLKQIAIYLNIGLDSLVFIDDSDFEINLIKNVLPEVETILLPKDKAVNYRDILAKCGLFDTLIVSEEDKKRGEMYKAEYLRKQGMYQSTNLLDYYKSLEMVVELCLSDEFTIPRIAQQTQKTNQFNLTTKRYTENDIKIFHEDKNTDVIALKLSDKFGDSGLVGTCIVKYENRTAVIDTLLLSCRVLGRGVEDVFLSRILKLAKGKGCDIVVGQYYPTKKNMQVCGFYPSKGFVERADIKEDNGKIFHFNLNSNIDFEPDYFKAVNSCMEKEA